VARFRLKKEGRLVREKVILRISEEEALSYILKGEEALTKKVIGLSQWRFIIRKKIEKGGKPSCI